MKRTDIKTTKRNSNLLTAKKAGNDEFYTRYEDVVAELSHYDERFRGKSIHCCCDSARTSAFWRYFEENFDRLNLTKLVATHRFGGKNTCANIIEATASGKHRYDVPLEGDGDVFSDECRTYMESADIVVTNPPFSVIRQFFGLIREMDVDYLVIGPNHAVTGAELRGLISDGRCISGVNSVKHFEIGNGEYKDVPCQWYTSLVPDQAKPSIEFSDEDPSAFSRYVNYNAIEIPRIALIPADYNGVMGVPITFFPKWNPLDFEIVGVARDAKIQLSDGTEKAVFARILIRRRRHAVVTALPSLYPLAA